MNIDARELADVLRIAALSAGGFVSICAECKCVLGVHADIRGGLSHGICQSCSERLYPQYMKGGRA